MKKRSAKVPTDGEILMDHIRELRTRIIVCAVVLLVGGVVGYIFYTPILEWIRSPLGTNLYYSTPAGSFNFILKVSSMVGILAAVPFIIFQLIMFIQPVVREKLSTVRVLFYTIGSMILAVAGALFAFYGILPGALKFFSGFQVAGLSALIDANNYLNFVINAIVTFIIVFQIPLIMVIIDRIKPIPPKRLLSAEKYVVVGGLLVSLIVPFAMDLTTCLLIASPIIILYNVSVGMIIVRHFLARHKRPELAVITQLTPKEMALDDELVSEFFAKRSQKVPALAVSTIADAIDVSELQSKPRAAVAHPVIKHVATHVVAPIETPVAATIQAPAPVIMPMTSPVVDTEPELVQTVLHKNVAAPKSNKPRPGEVKIEDLRAQIQARRDQEIADRIARYNTTSYRVINDIR